MSSVTASPPAPVIPETARPLPRTARATGPGLFFATTGRVVVAALLLAVLQMVISGSLLGDLAAASSGIDQRQAMTALLGAALLYAAALSYPVARSTWHGWRLAAAVFCVHAGIATVLIQLETAAFLLYLVPIVPAAVLPRLVLAGLLTAALYAPLLILVWGKLRGGPDAAGGRPWTFSLTGWAARFLVIGCFYAALYVFFGLFVAIPLAGPAFQSYYENLNTPPWMLLFQVGRGALWAAVVLPVLRMLRGPWWEGGLAVALLSSLLTAGALLVPNPFMPDAMRFAHFFELLSSNFVFGWVIGWVFRTSH